MAAGRRFPGPGAGGRGLHVIAYRHVDSRFPFLWEGGGQPAARWHAESEGPVAYLDETPDGAWAEFLRHEEITDPADLEGVDRALWCVEIGPPPDLRPRLRRDILQGDLSPYAACRRFAARVRRGGAVGLTAPRAALAEGRAGGVVGGGGGKAGKAKDGRGFVFFR